jgi:hypothetical protein
MFKSFVSFNKTLIQWKVMVIKTWNQTLKENIATLCLTLALFFNPFGFDIIQYWLIDHLGSIWRANFVLYCIAGLFFGLYLLLRGKLYTKSN